MAKTGRGGRRNHKLNRPTSASSSTPPAGPTNVKLTGKTLPEELINKILIRVPVKSLVRFRCVSKSWLLRTLHPKFISMHLNHNILYNKQLICNTYANDVVNNKRVYNGKKVVAFLSPHDPTVIPVLSIDMMSAVKSDYPLRINFNDFCKDMVFAGSVNGIVLLSHRKEMKGRFVVLWNPAINMWKRIRVPERKFESDCSDSFATETAIGLGFDVVSDDFMIVRIVPVYHSLSRECCRSRVEIYSTSHDSWTDICKDDCIPFWPIKAVCDFIIKGVLYFVGLDWLPEDLEGSFPHHHVILGAFDPCTSSYKKFFFPKHERNESSRVRPLNWKDSVAALVQSPGKYPNPVVDMYLLDEINGNWTKVYTIGPHSFEELRIPQCFITGELVLDTWAGDSERVPYFCNPEIRDPVFFNKEFGTLDPNWYDSYTHVESLVCVMGMELIGKENKNKTLPEDMINEILIRTPVKSLVRFRCVSKSWLLRTLHPKFISMHLTHNTLHKPKQLICNIHDYMTSTKLVAFLHLRAPIIPVRRSIDVNSADKPEYPREINFDDFFKDMMLAGSINGIMCLTINTEVCFPKYKEMEGCSVALWNPAINMWKPIRLPERKSGFDRLDDMSVGLGFDKATDDYKIVRIVPVVLPPDLQEFCWSRVEIYSAKCDSWMDLEKEGLAPFWPKLPNCTFIINDCPYWVGADRLPGDFTPFNPFQNEMLASLDPCTGMYKKVWYPKYVKNISTVVNPFKWKDSLALLIQSPGESPNSTVDMYKLDENTESWTKIYTIGEHQFEGLRIPQCLATGEIVLMTWKGGFVHAKLNPYFWNPETTDSFIKKREFANINLLWYESYSHTESLVCFKGMEIIGEDKNNGKEDGNKKKSKPPKKNWAELLSKDFETLLNLN